MRKILGLGVILVLIVILFFSISFNRNATSSPGVIRGAVILVDKNMLMIKEDKTQMEYEFNASPDTLKDVKTGYRVEVKTVNKKFSSINILGMPQADAELYDKWNKVIKTNSIF